MTMHAVILAGGSGTRLWPMSRQLFPKQFVALDGAQSLLQATVARLEGVIEPARRWVLAGAEQVQGAGAYELANLQLLLEPAARNTAPAIALVAAYLHDFHDNPTVLLLPADHVIRDVAAYHAALQVAETAAQSGKIVTFGMTPTHPETGFGYIQGSGAGAVQPVVAFKEKPDLATAQAYLASGAYSWNSGMFMARADVLLAAFKAHAPQIDAVLQTIRSAWQQPGADWRAAVTEHFPAMPNISFDYAVMEHTPEAVVVPCSLGWSDVGSWAAVHELAERDADGNSAKPQDVLINSRNVLVRGHLEANGRVVAALGVEDLCIIDTPDALLVAHKNASQDVGQVVKALAARGGETHKIHTTVRRPWGSYTVLEEAQGYKLKRIEVNPGGRLSLQSHKHRSEHWVVVVGVATVTCGDTVQTLHVGQSTYIPLGAKHRLENMTQGPVQIIEVQVGDYLGEDDIIRYEDIYGRSPS